MLVDQHFIINTYFTPVTDSSIMIDDVTNQVTQWIFNFDL